MGESKGKGCWRLRESNNERERGKGKNWETDRWEDRKSE